MKIITCSYKITTRLLAFCLCLCLIGSFIPTVVFAVSKENNIEGKVFEFDRENAYKFSEMKSSKSSGSVETYGKFDISGTGSDLILDGKKNNVPAYSVEEGNIKISYTYSDALLNASEDDWHLIDDKEKNVDVFKLNSSVQKGTIILQRSIDHLNWSDISVQTNVFAQTPMQKAALYETKDIELINGCYYRLIVVYELSKLVNSSEVLLVFTDKEYEYKRVAEVYEFYAEAKDEHIEDLPTDANKYRLGNTARVEFDGYSDWFDIGIDDLHYNWKLGDFFVSGFTSHIEKDGNIVFLKNIGDVVTLWYKLDQNIDALNNDPKLTITADPAGRDEYFQTATTNFGRGMLIIEQTDYENIVHEPVMYENYLEANTALNANTRVQLFEEGDYTVALDYAVTKDQVVDKTEHYSDFFSFSVRNANCMVYPFDVVTGEELTNSSITPNGFYLDLAKSRYLKIYIEKEIWAEGADGLTKDTRFNSAAKEGHKYTDEGIYTITAENEYTGLKTEKTIYVGTDRILMAYMTSDYSIADIQKLVSIGATIYEDGSIEMPATAPPEKSEPISNVTSQIMLQEIQNVALSSQAEITQPEDSAGESRLIAIAVSAVVAGVGGLAVVRKKGSKK